MRPFLTRFLFSYTPPGSLIKQLRDITGSPIAECKAALLQFEGNLLQAQELLKKKGLAGANKKMSRATGEGVVGVWMEGKGKAVLAEVIRGSSCGREGREGDDLKWREKKGRREEGRDEWMKEEGRESRMEEGGWERGRRKGGREEGRKGGREGGRSMMEEEEGRMRTEGRGSRIFNWNDHNISF